MEYLYNELFRLYGKLSHAKDPNERWEIECEIECEIENIRQEIAEEKGQ